MRDELPNVMVPARGPRLLEDPIGASGAQLGLVPGDLCTFV